MSGRDTVHGAFHINLDVEIKRVLNNLSKIGIMEPTKLEASALIAEKNKRAVMSKREVFDFISRMRGVK